MEHVVHLRPGQVVHLPSGEEPIGMAVHDGQLIVTTTGGVYRLGADGVLVPLRFRRTEPKRPRIQLRGFWQRVWSR